MTCREEFFRVYNKLPEAERSKCIIIYNGKAYTWNDLARLFSENPQLACFLWEQYKKIVAKAPSITVY